MTTLPRLLNIPHLLTRHFQMHAHSSTTALMHILNLLALLHIKYLALTLPTNPPLRLQSNARIPAADRSASSPASHFDCWRRLAIESSLVAGGLDDVFPEVASRSGCGGVSGQRSLAVGSVIFEVSVEEFEVVPDFAGLVVAAVDLAFEDCDVGLERC